MRFPWRSRSQREADLNTEIEAHLRMAAADGVARGETPDEALHHARREFGNVGHVSEITREVWDGGWIRGVARSRFADRLRQDIAYAVRGFRRSPGFTITVVLTLALGVGANAAIFSLLDHLFLKPPAGVRAPGEIRRLYIKAHSIRSPSGFLIIPTFNYPSYSLIRDAFSADADAGAYTTPTRASLSLNEGAVAVNVSHVSPNYLRLLGVPVVLGRYFSDDESRINVPAPVALISDGLWTRAFARDSAIVGRDIQIGNRSIAVIGITAPGFTGVDVDAADVFVALSALQGQGIAGEPWYESGSSYLSVLVRPRTDVPEQPLLTRAAFTYNRQPALPFYRIDTTSAMLAGPLSSARGPQQQGQEIGISTRVAGVSLAVLLIACANLANLLLVRAKRRQREIAVRLAMGVSRGRLFSQLLTESVCLAVLGGLAAIGVAWWGGRALREMLLPSVQWATGILDVRTLLVTGTLALVVGVVGGLAPALQARRHDMIDSLKASSREGTYRRSRVRSGLVVIQAAFSIVLVAGAGLFVRSLGNVRDIDLGYDADSLAYVSPGSARTPAQREVFGLAVAKLAERLASEPGINAIAPASTEPMRMWSSDMIKLPGRDSVPRAPGPNPDASYNRVSSNYFTTVGVRVLAGRTFAENEPKTSVVVNERMAQVFWPGRNPIGQCLVLDDVGPTCSTVIGVVENAHRWRIVEDPNMQYFLPGETVDGLILRIDPARWPTISSRARAELSALLPGSPSVTTTRMVDRFSAELRPWRMGATLFSAFGALALLVAAVGVYSVIAYAVSQRVQEMGVRVALGARSSDVISLVVGEGLRVVLVGAVVGIGIIVMLGKVVASLLYGVTPGDPIVITISALTIVAVGTVAALLPAWRASRVDPINALRAE